MQRYDRARFVAFGFLPAANAAALLIYGLTLATSSTGGAGRPIPALLVIAATCLLIALAATVKRGRDLGWPLLLTLAAFWLSGPFLPILIGYFALARTREEKAASYGPPPVPPNLITWGWALLNLLWPWMVLAVLGKVL